MSITIKLVGPSTTPGAPQLTPAAINAAVNAALAGVPLPIAADPVVTLINPADLIGISQNGTNVAISAADFIAALIGSGGLGAAGSFLLEDGSGGLLLEDGSGYLTQEQ